MQLLNRLLQVQPSERKNRC